MNILVLNVGSTTLKYALIDSVTRNASHQGTIDPIGTQEGGADSHAAAVEMVLARLTDQRIDAIGHRIVQGGLVFSTATVVDADSLARLARLDSLAPLHNPPARGVIESLVARGLSVPQVMVFDTAYFAALPEVATRYAIPESVARQHSIRRYGAHGTSHEFVTGAAIAFLGKRSSPLKTISLHLGGGCSATAAVGGLPVETSMGMTPLEGLVMATRSGDLDPAAVLYLIDHVGMSGREVHRMLHSQSGLLGLCGESDMRVVLQRCQENDAVAQLALDLFVHRIRKTLGGYVAVMGGLDALIFTAGIGQHAAEVRRRVTENLTYFGIAINEAANASAVGEGTIVDISDASAMVKTLIVPTDESLAIAEQVNQWLSTDQR